MLTLHGRDLLKPPIPSRPGDLILDLVLVPDTRVREPIGSTDLKAIL